MCCYYLKIAPKKLHKMDKMGMEFLVLWMYFILRNILCLNKFMSLLRCSHATQKQLYYLFHLTKSSIFFQVHFYYLFCVWWNLVSLTWISAYILLSQQDKLLEKRHHAMYFFQILLMPSIIWQAWTHIWLTRIKLLSSILLC